MAKSFATGAEIDTSTNIMFTDNTYTTYLPITLDSQTNSSIAHVIQSNGMSMLFFDKAGTYNLAYNVETGVLSITSVGGDDDQGDGDESGSIDDYIIFISVIDNTNGNQTLYPTKKPDNPNEVYVRVETIAANSYLSVSAVSKADYSSTTYGTLRNGTVKPRRFQWEDGAIYQIDRILHITPAASTKVGGRGIRYTVMIEGQEKYIFREDDKWFMEAPIIK